MRNLTSAQHKWFISILVLIVFSTSLLFGIDSYGGDYLSHNREILSITLTFVNTAMVIVIAAILIKIEDDLSKHDLKLEAYYRDHTKKLADLKKK